MSRPCLAVNILSYFLCIVKSQYGCTSETSVMCTINRATGTDGQDIICSDANECNVECNSADSCNTNIYCPSDGSKCTINCNTHNACTSANIISANCDEVLININGHTSDINIDISEQTGTKNVLLNCKGYCYDNRIDASSINGVLNISCIDECDSNIIYCPSAQHCNIDCKDCIDTFIYANNLNLVSWHCSRDCTNSSVSDSSNNIQSWKECEETWLLLPINTQCPTSDEALDSSQFTILAFVLIGTLIGCLCVIVVTAIICCICWHEHQIKALNLQHNNNNQTENKSMPKPVDTGHNGHNGHNTNPNNMTKRRDEPIEERNKRYSDLTVHGFLKELEKMNEIPIIPSPLKEIIVHYYFRLYVRAWNERTYLDFKGVTLVGYLCDDGMITQGHLVRCKPGRIFVHFNRDSGYFGNKYDWIDVPNDRICAPPKYWPNQAVPTHDWNRNNEDDDLQRAIAASLQNI